MKVTVVGLGSTEKCAITGGRANGYVKLEQGQIVPVDLSFFSDRLGEEVERSSYLFETFLCDERANIIQNLIRQIRDIINIYIDTGMESMFQNDLNIDVLSLFIREACKRIIAQKSLNPHEAAFVIREIQNIYKNKKKLSDEM